MTEFSQKRFEWLKTETNLANLTQEERGQVFNQIMIAHYVFEAAEEFAEVFRHQEDNLNETI